MSACRAGSSPATTPQGVRRASDTPTPKTLDIGTAAFHEVWTTDRDARPDRGHGARADRPPGAHAAAARSA